MKWLSYALVGGFNTLLGITTYGMLLHLGIPFPVATALSLALGVVVGFHAHRRLVFRREGLFTRYVAVWLVVYGLANLLIWILQRWFGPFLAGVLSAPVNSAVAFLALRRFVFKDPSPGSHPLSP